MTEIIIEHRYDSFPMKEVRELEIGESGWTHSRVNNSSGNLYLRQNTDIHRIPEDGMDLYIEKCRAGLFAVLYSCVGAPYYEHVNDALTDSNFAKIETLLWISCERRERPDMDGHFYSTESEEKQ